MERSWAGSHQLALRACKPLPFSGLRFSHLKDDLDSILSSPVVGYCPQLRLSPQLLPFQGAMPTAPEAGTLLPPPPGGRGALLALVARAAAQGPISGLPRPGDRSFPFLWWFSADRWTSVYQFPVFICLLPRWRLGKVLL